MARKYTSLLYDGDPNIIKDIFHKVYPNYRYIQISYTRDDRWIDLNTDSVLIDDSIESCLCKHYYREGYICKEPLSDCIFDASSNQLIRRVVSISFGKDDKLHLELSNEIVLDIGENRVYVDGTAAYFCEQVKGISGMEWVVDSLNKIIPYYEDDLPAETAIKLLFIAEQWNLYNQIPLYAHAIECLRYEISSNSEGDTFWEAIGIPSEILPCLSNYYIGDDVSSYSLSKMKSNGSITMWLNTLSDNVKEALIEAALEEKTDLLQIEEFDLCYLRRIIEEDEEFFIEYLNTLMPNEDIIKVYLRDIKALENHGFDHTLSNIRIIKTIQGAANLGMDVYDYDEKTKHLNQDDVLWNLIKKM